MKINLSKQSIISLGEVLWDLFPDGQRFGGASANFACHAALLGGTVKMFSAVGYDERGDIALQIMQRHGVDTSNVQRIEDAATGTVGVTVDDLGRPSFVIHEGAAWDRMAWTTDMQECIRKSDTVYFGTLGQREPIARATIRQAVTLAKECSIRRVLDVNLRKPYFDQLLVRDSIALCSVLKLSDEELDLVLDACSINNAQDPKHTLKALLDKFDLELVAMTRGPNGALLVSRDESLEQAGIPTLVCDTVGAGDAFTAALVIGLNSGASLRNVAFDACTVASNVCSYAGAIPA